MTKNTNYKKPLPHSNMQISLSSISKGFDLVGFVQKSHKHPMADFIFIKKGTCQLNLDSTHVLLQQNDALLLNPDLAHASIENMSDDFAWVMSDFDGVTFLNNEASKFQEYFVIHLPEEREEVMFYLDKIEYENAHPDEYSPYMIQNSIHLLLALLVRKAKNPNLLSIPKHVSKECDMIEDHINQHFKEDITLDSLAELTNLNKFYVGHLFKNNRGISPIRYLINRRLVEAKRLLTTTALPISKVALESGFTSQSYFSQVFRKELHISPNHYRRRSKQELERARD